MVFERVQMNDDCIIRRKRMAGRFSSDDRIYVVEYDRSCIGCPKNVTANCTLERDKVYCVFQGFR